jgi:hypothetical protein
VAFHIYIYVELVVQVVTTFPNLDVVSSRFSPCTLSVAKNFLMRIGWASFFCGIISLCVFSFHFATVGVDSSA